MILQLDDDFADDIVRQVLLETYVNLKNDIKNKKDAHEDDIALWKKVVPAIEVLGQWYFYDFDSDVAAFKKRKKK